MTKGRWYKRTRLSDSVRLATLPVVLAVLLQAPGSFAASIAFDSAADSAYNNGWTNGSNGGFGWGGGWSLSMDRANSGIFLIESSTLNGGGDPGNDGDINTPQTAFGRAWGMAALPPSNPGILTASRPFNGGLSVGQTFMVDMDNGNFQNPSSGNRGFAEVELTGVPLAGPRFRVTARNTTETQGNYFIRDAGGERNTMIPVTDQGIRIEFTLTGANSYEVTFSGIGTDGPGDLPKTFSGTLAGGDQAGPIRSVSLLDVGSGIGARFHQDFNNLTITAATIPEPASLVLLGTGMFAAVGCRWRHRGQRRVSFDRE